MFQIDPSSAIGIVALGALYAFVCSRMRRRPKQSQVLSFSFALVAMALTFGPLDALADNRSFWAHMLEHSMQSWLIPPLLLLGTPDWMLRPILMDRRIYPIARALTNPLTAFITFTSVYVFAHDPPIFNLMLTNMAFHIAVHLTFMAAGVMLWWPLLSPLPEFPRLPYPTQILYLFLLMVPMTAVAAPITLATTVVYPWYAAGPHPFGLTPIQDEVIGGILMWVADSFYLMVVFTLIFFRWARREDVDVPEFNRRRAPELRALRAQGRG